MTTSRHHRRIPVGAEWLGDGVHFRVWAPRRQRVEVVLEGGPGAPGSFPLQAESGGYFATFVETAGPGTSYRFRLDSDEDLLPDPASRYQPEGPFGPSLVVDPDAYRWRDAEWRGVSPTGQVIYEMHVGTFTPEGTWQAATQQLEELARIGVTLLEVMPVADFDGRFGWGYDGVDPFAPTRLYGTPDDFRAFVDRAHEVGVGVILDVVYNHFGPSGCFLPVFSPDYLTDRYETDWGEPLNFDGPNSAPVREFVLSNAAYWIREFHLDGLRLDATQNIYDSAQGDAHILTEIGRAARAAAGDRTIYIVAENEPQDTRLVRSDAEGGFGLDALWNDDFHHAAMVALSGRKEAYYRDYLGAPQEFISATKWGFLYQGQNYSWQSKRRGTPSLDLPPHAFIIFLQNHDQIANSARGDRVDRSTSPGRLRAMTALTLLSPATPMLFMGQEFGASTPFLYFADHDAALSRSVYEGRRAFLKQFPSIVEAERSLELPDPSDPSVFERCKLRFEERETNRETYDLHIDLLRLRREDPCLSAPPPRRVDGAVLSGQAFVLRMFGDKPDNDRLLVVNLGRELTFTPAPEPLLAPPEGKSWRVLWQSEDVKYGGQGMPPPETPQGEWQIFSEMAVLLAPGASAVPKVDGQDRE